MVVMPEYLMISSKQNPSKPRIISEVKKNCFSKLKLSFTTSLQDFGKPKYSGQLFWNTGNSDWVLTAAEVRQGNLILINKETLTTVLRQPLRELNLRACNAPRTFCLAEEKGVRLLLFQALTDDEYEKWIRILAAELICQTPLHNVRFLDILSILRNKEFDKNSLRRGKSEECITKTQRQCEPPKKLVEEPLTQSNNQLEVKEENNKRPSPEKLEKAENEEKLKKVKVKYQKSVQMVHARERKHKIWMRAQSMNNLANFAEKPSELILDESEISLEDHNQPSFKIRHVDDFSFLSVKERKKFFESLNSELETKAMETSSPLIRSNSVNTFKQTTNFVFERNKLCKRKRTKSLHDLHKTPVKEICQLFESQERNVEQSPLPMGIYNRMTQERFQRQEKKLEKLTNQISEAEEAIKRVTEDIKSIGPNTLRKKQGLEVFEGLQKRLDEEHSKLARLKDEINKVVKDSQRNLLNSERYNERSQ